MNQPNRQYSVHHRLPSITEYKTLCRSVGWEPYMNFEAAEASLEHSLFAAVVTSTLGETVGMGRVVGDGHLYFYIQDIAVLPEHQGQGAGQLIMEAIAGYLREHAPDKAFVGLFASQGAEAFYERFGLQRHEGMTGMFGVVQGGEIR